MRAFDHVITQPDAPIVRFHELRIDNKWWVYLVCGIAGLYFAYLSVELFIDAWTTGNLDVRGIDMPYWLQFLPMPFGYGLVGLEFFMYLAGLRHYYTYDLGEVKDSV